MSVVVLDIRSEQARIQVVLRLMMMRGLRLHIYIKTPMARPTPLRVTAHSVREGQACGGHFIMFALFYCRPFYYCAIQSQPQVDRFRSAVTCTFSGATWLLRWWEAVYGCDE